jgi:cell division protein FtsA
LTKTSWGTTIAGLDIGTTKTCAVVATSTPQGLDIIGVGEAPCAGLRKGVITDLEETVRSIEAATEKAERMAGVHISHVYVGVTGEHVQSTNNRGVVAISGEDREVVRADVKRVVEASKLIDVGADRQIIHALPRHYTVDGHDGVTDPIGMSGARLARDSSRRVSCSSRSRRRPQRCSRKRSTSACCSSISAAEPRTSRCIPRGARF